jgi:hypothetical protein
LAQGAGAADPALSEGSGANAANARDRIGKGPWQNFKGEVIAKDVDELHADGVKISLQTSLTERGTMVAGVGYAPNYHDALTGSQPDGKAWPANLNLTCNNWTSSTFGSAMLGHTDRTGGQNRSWNSAHMSRSCSVPRSERYRRQRIVLAPPRNSARPLGACHDFEAGSRIAFSCYVSRSGRAERRGSPASNRASHQWED